MDLISKTITFAIAALAAGTGGTIRGSKGIRTVLKPSKSLKIIRDRHR